MSSAEQQKIINITLYDKSGSNILASTTGIVKMQIIELSIFELVNKFPEYKIVLYGSNIEEFYEVYDFMLEFITDTMLFKVKVCAVYKKQLPQVNQLEIYGKIAPFDLYDKVNTMYLGSNTKDAINKLGFEQKLILKRNVNAEYHLINTTPLEKLIDICKCEADFPYWSIGVTEIILSKPQKKEKFYPLDEITSLYENSPSEKSDVAGNYDEDFYSAGYNRVNLLGNKNNYQALPLLSKNLYLAQYRKPYLVMNGKVNTIYPYLLGTMMENGLLRFKNIDYWVVTSIINTYKNNKVTSQVQYSTWKEN